MILTISGHPWLYANLPDRGSTVQLTMINVLAQMGPLPLRSRSVDSYAKMTYRTARADQSAWNIGTPTSILGDQDIRAALSNDTGLFKDSS